MAPVLTPADHRALQLQNGYAVNGHVPALKAGAASAAQVVRGHIAELQQMMR